MPDPGWPPTARRRLTDVFASQSRAFVVSGHVHQSRVLSLDGTQHLWAPTVWAVLPDHAQAVLGAKRSGIMSLEFAAGVVPRPQFHEPDGIKQLTLAADIPDPYRGR